MDLVQVDASVDPFVGELRRGLLESEGIPVVLKGGGDTPYRMGPTYLFVPLEHEMRARELLADVDAGRAAVVEPAGDAGDS